MPIFDAHMHLGESIENGMVLDEATQLENCKRYGVEGGIILPFPVVADYRRSHDRIAEFCSKNPGFLGALTLNPPLLGKEETIAEMERCIKELGFRVVKFQPTAYAMFPSSQWAGLMFEQAARLGAVVMVHTGWGLPHSLPALLMPRAQEFPNLPIIIAHGGFGSSTGYEAVIVAQNCPNVYLETSWCWGMDIRHFVGMLGAGRVMMGSDFPENVPAALTIYDTIPLSDTERRACLWGTAADLFDLQS